ncbi:MAG: ABC transporter permease [Microcoleus sp. SM1_3_4]|nr:ABC transporter permease [Microcoleus sp. SM1_3_4]
MSLSPTDLLSLTCNSLLGNPLRSALTTVGVFMGVAAVSATLQVGNISRAVIAEKLAKRSAPQAYVGPEWDPVSFESLQLRLEDLEFLKQRLTKARAISSLDWAGATDTIFQGQKGNPFMMAVTQDFWVTSGKQLVAGRFFTPADFANYRPVVILDKFIADRLFKSTNPIGQRIYVNSRPYIVVGIVPTNTNREQEPQGQLFIPMSVYNSLTGSREIGSLLIRPHKLQELEQVGKQAQKLLEQRFPGKKFYVGNNMEEILAQQQTLEMVSRSLLAVGMISLLVGGVGIANITIASVAERTREIGLRRAIGATQREVMLQFYLEAVLLSLFGGILAIVTVHVITGVVADTFKLPYKFDSGTAVLALGSALLVGVGAGFLPACKASQLDPVKALRSD